MRKQIILKENELIDIIKKSVLNEIRVENPAKMLRYTDDKLEGMQSIDDSMLKFIAQFFLSNGISPSAVENCKNLSRLTTPLEMQKAISEVKAELDYYNEIGKEEETPSKPDTEDKQPSGYETGNNDPENEVHLNESQFNGMIRRMVNECLRNLLHEEVDMGQLDAMRDRPRAKECPSDVKNEIRRLRHLIDEYEKEGKDTEPLTRKIKQLKSKCGM